VISSRHLNCRDCRIRVRAKIPEIALLEGRCPICEATLSVSSASNVLGFRCFDLYALANHESRDGANSSGGVDSAAAATWAPAQVMAAREHP
jgi:hypothetical protein